VILDFKEKIQTYSSSINTGWGGSSTGAQHYYKRIQSYSRLMLISPLLSLSEVYMAIYQRLLYVKGETEATPELFAADFPTLVGDVDPTSTAGHKLESMFDLNVVNLQRQKDGYYMYTNAPCDFCKKRNCMNCPLEYTDDIRLQELTDLNTTERTFRIELVWKKGAN
jgi:hypothetical protein